MMDAVVSFLWADSAANEVLLDSDHTQNSSFVAGFRPFRFTDGWGIVTPTSDADFAGMCKAFKVAGYDDPRVATIGERIKHRHLMTAIMDTCYAAAANLTSDQAMDRLNAERVPCSLVVTPAELPSDEHAAAIGLFVESDHPVVGRTRIPRHPTRFGAGEAELGGPAPRLGEHTDEVLAELGLGERIDELRRTGVIG
jgi:crotonobetainyl-CoA:carnitine CoA-transferase CaiB-like acyl-CoA transferase